MSILIQAFYNLNFAVIPLIMILHTCLSSSIPAITPTTPQETCGYVHTSTGKTMPLLKGVPLTPENFNHVRNITLKESLFSPTNGCAIQVCGFMSSGTLQEEGSTSDYADCMEFTSDGSGGAAFSMPFYMSSIDCGCKTPTSKCTSTCTDSPTKSWTTNDCAVLYQERNCNECYFPPTRVSEHENYTTDNTHHVMSLAVRPNCRVRQYSPGMRKVHWFKDIAQPLVYEYDLEQYAVINSSFVGGYETFVCECGMVSPPVSKPPGESEEHGLGLGVSVVIGVGVLLAVVLVGGYVLRGKVVRSKVGGVMRMLRRGADLEHELQFDTSVSVETEQVSMDQVSTPESTLATLNNHKEEKLDDVKKLLELLCGCTTIPTSQKPLDNQAVASVNEQFKAVCKPENVLPRESILFTESSYLGSGQFGTVYKGVMCNNNDDDGLRENVAVKVTNWVGCTDDHVKSFLREVKAYQDVRGSSFIVKFVGACVCGDGMVLVTEFCEGGCLGDYLGVLRSNVCERVKVLGDGYTATEHGKLVQQRDDVVAELLSFSYQIACGMEWLSGRGVVHGDLAVRNVLLKGDKSVRICDFGLSRKCCGGEYVLGSLSKFPYNSLAPEVCKRDDHTYKLSSSVDVWAYGCTLYEMFTLGGSMYAHVNAEGADKVIEVMRLLVQGFRHERFGVVGGDVYEKVMECWDEEPGRRPSFSSLKEFFGGKCV